MVRSWPLGFNAGASEPKSPVRYIPNRKFDDDQERIVCVEEFGGAMGNVLVGGIHVVQAVKDGEPEYWAAATIRQKAVAAVEKELGDGWTVTLTDRRLTGQRLSKLRLTPNSVQRL